MLEVMPVSSKGALVVGVILALLAWATISGWAAEGDNRGFGGGQLDPAQRWQQMLERFDQDHDGKISKDEYQGPAEAFGRLDANGDGFLQQEEVAKFDQPGGGPGGGFRDLDPAQRWQRMVEFMDGNRDGQISRDEFRGPEKMFQVLDRNGDGVITEDEGRAGRPGEGGPGGPGGAGGDYAARLKLLLKQWDKDGDGKLSRQEWQGREEMFARLDADGDGFITEEEIGRGLGGPMPPRNPVQQLIGVLDRDADGQVSAEEWSAFFQQTDANGNGFLTQDELMKALRPPMGDMGPRPGGAQEGGGAPPAEANPQ